MREQEQLVQEQVEIRFLNSFSDLVCLKLLGREFHTLGTVYLIDCCPKEIVFTFCLCEKRADIGQDPGMDSFVDRCS